MEFMAWSAAILVGCLISTLTSFLLNQKHISLLYHIPKAHWSTPYTSLWSRYHRRGGSQALAAITVAHQQKGPIVLIGPNEVSVSSFEAAKKVYVEKGGFAKPKWWAESFTSYGVRNMVSMQGGYGSKEHATRKRDMGNVYAKSFLMGNDNMQAVSKIALKDLREVLNSIIQEKDGVVDVYNFNGAVNADFVSMYLFGRSNGTGFIQNAPARDTYYRNHDTWLKGKPGREETQEWLEAFGTRQCQHAESVAQEGEKNASDAVVYKQLRARGVYGKELASEMLDHFIAGAEAPRTILTYLEWELSKRPEMQVKLREELRSQVYTDLTPDFKALDSLPVLEAIITETLRVYTPTPGPQYRITPRGGVTISELFIPEGVQISASLSILHRNPSVFQEPGRWEPFRWTVNDQAKLEDMRKWFWAFSKGSRICIGKDFTLIVMKLIVAAIYSHYETEIVEDDNMEQEDKFLAGPIGEKLVLRFRPVQ